MAIRRVSKLAAVFALSGMMTGAGAADTPHSMPMQGSMASAASGSGSQGRGMMSCPMMGGGSGGTMGGGMMSGGMGSARGLPTLPPGNEKLQLQMQAEIMQKVGEIMAKYAAQIPSR